MIVTSLNRSYPNLVDDTQTRPHITPVFELEEKTRGDWPSMRETTVTGYFDYVVGTWNDMIVSAYPFDAIKRLDNGKVQFVNTTPQTDRESPRGEWLIGCPIPGGPWKPGQARGTRRYALETYLDDHPELLGRIDEDFGGRMAENLVRHFATGKKIDVADYPQLAAAKASQAPTGPATGVTVVREPGGTVVVTIPTGTRAQILIEPEA